MMDARNIGLRNIEVADTKISAIDGEKGKLIYRGYDILDLVNHSTFEETSYLLLFGELPKEGELRHYCYRLRACSKIARTNYQKFTEPTENCPTDGYNSIFNS